MRRDRGGQGRERRQRDGQRQISIRACGHSKGSGHVDIAREKKEKSRQEEAWQKKGGGKKENKGRG